MEGGGGPLEGVGPQNHIKLTTYSSEYRMQNAKYRIQNEEFRIQNTAAAKSCT
jgi:hypothetical protein